MLRRAQHLPTINTTPPHHNQKRGRLSWTLRLVVLVPELMVEGLLVAM